MLTGMYTGETGLLLQIVSMAGEYPAVQFLGSLQLKEMLIYYFHGSILMCGEPRRFSRQLETVRRGYSSLT